jgi:hypothetical protein
VTIKGEKAASTVSRLEKLSGVNSVERLTDSEDLQRVRLVVDSLNLAEAVFDAIVGDKCKITELTPEGATLEEAFANLTR